MNRSHAESRKIQPHHLERAAYVYVRQSSPRQVTEHLGSRRRQYERVDYERVDWAVSEGWPRERSEVVDEDQGKSGGTANARPGVARLVSAVAQGAVGIVIALEVTRLSRNSPDWHHLLYLCRFTETLIADEHTVYDPQLSGDRMVLNLHGQMGELELETMIGRMVSARWSKAERGELYTIPPAGYDLDDAGQWVMSSDEAVVHALRNPIYTGADVFGKNKTVRRIDGDGAVRIHMQQRKREDWPVLIKDHHAAYITFERYGANRDRLQGNQRMNDASGGDRCGAVREGAALLQGLVRCGQCGRRMGLSYGGSRRGQIYQYRCMRARQQHGGSDCQVIGGKRIDQSVVDVFLEATHAYAERFVRSIKEECLSRVVPLGEAHLRDVVREYTVHYHEERNHQGLANELITPPAKVTTFAPPIQRRERVGGVLNSYYREAA